VTQSSSDEQCGESIILAMIGVETASQYCAACATQAADTGCEYKPHHVVASGASTPHCIALNPSSKGKSQS